MAALLRWIARHPVAAFVVIGLGVGLGAFLVTGALAAGGGVFDLAWRSVRWRVPRYVALFAVPVGATLISALSMARER